MLIVNIMAATTQPTAEPSPRSPDWKATERKYVITVSPELSGPKPSEELNRATGSSNSWYEPMMLIITTNTTTCRIEGSVTCQNTCQLLAPSIRAASSRLLS